MMLLQNAIRFLLLLLLIMMFGLIGWIVWFYPLMLDVPPNKSALSPHGQNNP